MERFRLKRIKGFIDSEEIELKPLTFIIGQNSSGKSSIMRFPLVLKQTFLDDSMAPLLLYGKTIDYGNFEDVVFEHDRNESIEFELIIDRKELNRFSPYVRNRFLRFFSGLEKFKLNVCILQDEYGVLKIKKFILSDIDINHGEVFSLNLIGDSESYEVKGIIQTSFKIKAEKFVFDKFIPDFKILPLDVKDDDDEQVMAFRYLFMELIRYLNFYASNIFYIGPFRKTPERSYRYRENAVNYVGHDGEFAPAILGQDIRKGKQLINQVSNWLSKNLNHRIDVEDLIGSEYGGRTDLFRLMVTDEITGQKNNLIDVGHGLSQLIPIVVQTFLHQSKTSYDAKRSLAKLHIIEQPELHLHPSAQACLIDLFIEGTRENYGFKNKFLVETHSEHMIIRLRRYIVEGKINPEEVAIYYTEKLKSKNHNIIRKLKIDEFGNISNWPEGFFEEDYNEVLKLRSSLHEKQGGSKIPW
ncbi:MULTISPECIES: DUF3696 domain-containing protein [Bacillus]|uniref:DUF3696 domain-containing protein n=3 Tax=Bacillus pacificus TaxID=2026187 RepID=A0A6I6YW20_9BACI|nr:MULTISPECIES: DUF3696 domain-containing protein [Bacillus]KMQ27010.1 hypothetical protein TU53_28295 [Bacillus cereus]KXX95089.1 hypothetical protein AT277_09500 [Bacillus cereus]KXY94099.1 hypothetical protein AT276_12940 [Bacillus cereus]MBL3795053.1 DUF3696 domain-containing protein [Bacillus cereus]MBL3856462.1 DUF3696 domain-containing protein [Bacillus cereus]